MSTALLEPPVRLFGESEPSAARGGGRLTLEERLRAMWHTANAEGAADCPLARPSTSARTTVRDDAAECGSCGSRLS